MENEIILSRAQKIIRWFTSKALFEKMEQDSKLWIFDCECGQTSSIWDIGGIKYKAKGYSRSLTKCPRCQKNAMRKIYKKDSPQ